MKALSIQQPFGSLITKGYKSIETRTWKTNYRGDFLICTSQKIHPFMDDEEWIEWLAYSFTIRKSELITDDLGMAIGVANLWDCCLMEPIDERKSLSGYVEGIYSWKLKDIYMIDPFPIKGKQGWFNVDLPKGYEHLMEKR